MTSQPLMHLQNLGLRSCNWLADVDIKTEQKLRELGAVRAFVKVRDAGCHPSLNLLYALEGALQGCHWTELSESDRSNLLQALDHEAQNAA